MLAQVLEAMAGHAVLIREQREERAAQAERYRLAEERRRLQQAFASREKERIAFVDAVHTQLIERRKLEAVLGHFEGRGADRLEPMIAWVKRRMAQIEATIGPHALDLSARAAKIDFDEPQTGKTSEYYYSSFRELDLWSDYDEDGTARSSLHLNGRQLPACSGAIRKALASPARRAAVPVACGMFQWMMKSP